MTVKIVVFEEGADDSVKDGFVFLCNTILLQLLISVGSSQAVGCNYGIMNCLLEWKMVILDIHVKPEKVIKKILSFLSKYLLY